MGKGYIYRGYGSEIEDIDVSDIINNNEPIEEVVMAGIEARIGW